MHDEKGYVQFHCDWERAAPPAGSMCDALRDWRDRLFGLGLIGVYPDGIGYGNMSCRSEADDAFVITGTATGGIESLRPEHLTKVVECDFDRNWLRCRGPVQASSESLSHAAVYRGDPRIRAVIHVHHLKLWNSLFDRSPTTDPLCEAGTPAMAHAIEKLFREHGVREPGLLVMGGHREGLIAFGSTLDTASDLLLNTIEQFGGT
jgi:hypothetical protein